MKYVIVFLMMAAQGCGVQSQSNDEQSREVRNFEAISVSSGIDLYLTQSDTESLRLTSEGGDLSEVVTEVRDGQLFIHFERNSGWKGWNFNENVKAFVNFKMLNKIEASGGSDVFSENSLNLGDLQISVSGGSDVEIDLNASNVRASASGGSDLILRGEARNFEGTVSGGSDIKATNFRLEYAKVNASGGSDAYLWVEEGCDCHSSGGSDIHYK